MQNGLGESLKQGGGSDFGCRFCEETFDKTANLRNHVLNHFKEPLMELLPNKKPYDCPMCSTTSRDKITLLRHVAFTHKKVFEHCKEEDFKPKGGTPKKACKTPSKSRPKKGGKKASITSDFVSDLSEQAYASKPDVDVEDVEDDFEMPLEVEILDDDN